jgi:hypothetical protein
MTRHSVSFRVGDSRGREMKLREEHAKITLEESMGYGVFLKSEARNLALICQRRGPTAFLPRSILASGTSRCILQRFA